MVFETHRDLSKIGKPLDRSEWLMTPPTVNAYYDPQLNSMNFPAGILQPPLFDPRMDDAPNYGNTGATIGHELTHGFDDEGRQFDAAGNLKDWWTAKDGEEFARRALANIHTRMGEVGNLVVRLTAIEAGVRDEEPVDRVLLDLPEPWTLVDAVATVLRPGGIFLSYLPTIIQSHELVETLRRRAEWGLIETFETLFRPWNIDGQSVRPFHRMVAHTGFITVARRIVPSDHAPAPVAVEPPEPAA